jgi:hypothetical protein
MVGWLSHYVKQYASKMSLLSDMLKDFKPGAKGLIKWTVEQDIAFEKIKVEFVQLKPCTSQI